MTMNTKTEHLFLRYDNNIENILINGFIMVHLIIGVFYIIISVLSTNSGFCLICYGNECDDCGDDCGGCAIILVIVVIVGILGTVFIIYYDVMIRVVERHHIKKIDVIDILPYNSI